MWNNQVLNTSSGSRFTCKYVWKKIQKRNISRRNATPSKQIKISSSKFYTIITKPVTRLYENPKLCILNWLRYNLSKSVRAGPGRVWPNRLIAYINFMIMNENFWFYNKYRKVHSIREIALFESSIWIWMETLECELAPYRSHWRLYVLFVLCTYSTHTFRFGNTVQQGICSFRADLISLHATILS